jgi:hypothetical protein
MFVYFAKNLLDEKRCARRLEDVWPFSRKIWRFFHQPSLIAWELMHVKGIASRDEYFLKI